MDSYDEQNKLIAKNADIANQNAIFNHEAIEDAAKGIDDSNKDIEIGRKGFETMYAEFHDLLRCPSCMRKILDEETESDDSELAP